MLTDHATWEDLVRFPMKHSASWINYLIKLSSLDIYLFNFLFEIHSYLISDHLLSCSPNRELVHNVPEPFIKDTHLMAFNRRTIISVLHNIKGSWAMLSPICHYQSRQNFRRYVETTEFQLTIVWFYHFVAHLDPLSMNDIHQKT